MLHRVNQYNTCYVLMCMLRVSVLAWYEMQVFSSDVVLETQVLRLSFNVLVLTWIFKPWFFVSEVRNHVRTIFPKGSFTPKNLIFSVF